MTITEAAKTYCARKINLKRTSADQYTYSVRAFTKFLGRDPELSELTEMLLMAFVSHRLETTGSCTARRDQGNLITIWRFAHRRGWAPPPPVELERVHVPEKIPVAWTLEEMGRIRAAISQLRGKMREIPVSKADWWDSLLMFLYDSGARLNAALSVSADDMRLSQRCCILRAETAKTGIPQVVYFGDDTATAISRIYCRTRIFVWEYPWTKRKVWLDFKEILANAGVDHSRGVGFHRIRKTNATQTVIHEGWDKARVQLGHSDERMTRRYVDTTQIPRQSALLPRI